ncbi:MAG: YicC family protein [Bacteroidota bacterium]|jgi:uncharacterized protein (TIGR00255 family)|nr:YicC family protein [Bacteroidota bacterium]
MLYSMTGFGRTEGMIGNRQIAVEIKSLNGKQLDIFTKLPSFVRAHDIDIRTMLQNELVRGSIEFNLQIKQDGSTRPMVVNKEMATYYYNAMQSIAEDLQVSQDHILATLMQLPEVVTQEQPEQLSEEEWMAIKQFIQSSMEALMQHRLVEGAVIKAGLLANINTIQDVLSQIIPLEQDRMERIKQRIQQHIAEHIPADQIDANRFEQELIFYIEKLDFTEEKQRLTQHCVFFKEVLDNNEISKGKKLGFILQEVGREINTLGSKANDATIQQLVVKMKDELEKAKEQILNAL